MKKGGREERRVILTEDQGQARLLCTIHGFVHLRCPNMLVDSECAICAPSICLACTQRPPSNHTAPVPSIMYMLVIGCSASMFPTLHNQSAELA